MIRLGTLRSRYQVTGDPLQVERRVELLAVAVTLLLLLQILYSVLRLGFLSEPEAIAPALDNVAERAIRVPEPIDPALSEAIRSRPLFWAGRRPLEASKEPPKEVVKAPPDAGGDLSKVQLVGIFGVGDSAGIITLVEDKKRRILVGEKIEGWTLDKVERDRAVLSDKERRQLLMLKPPAKKDKS